MEEGPEDLDAWVVKNCPSKSDYQRVDKLKVHFGHFVINRATKCTANIINNLNPLWNPVPPSGKSITDMLRAIKLQRFRATAQKNAIKSMCKKEGYLSEAWGDNNEKLAYVRATVEEKMEKYDPATKHPKHWLAFYYAVIPLFISLFDAYHYNPVFRHLLRNRTILKFFHQRICKILSVIVAAPEQFLKPLRKEVL